MVVVVAMAVGAAALVGAVGAVQQQRHEVGKRQVQEEASYRKRSTSQGQKKITNNSNDVAEDDLHMCLKNLLACALPGK